MTDKIDLRLNMLIMKAEIGNLKHGRLHAKFNQEINYEFQIFKPYKTYWYPIIKNFEIRITALELNFHKF